MKGAKRDLPLAETKIPRYVGREGRKRVESQQQKSSRGKEIERARVYAVRWKQRVFGRHLTYTGARDYYRRKILLLILKEWHSLWWEQRREWRLLVRADIHRRYHVFQSVWKSWTLFAEESRRKNRKIQKALKHNERVAAKKVYGAWQTYIEGRREEERKIKTANTYLERTTLINFFRLWTNRKDQLSALKEMHKEAAAFRRDSLQRQAFLIWKQQHILVLGHERRVLEAVSLSKRHLQQRILSTWVQYTTNCRCQRQAKETASLFAQTSILKHYYDVWWNRCHARQLLSGFLGKLVVECGRAKVRQCFIRWKIFVYYAKRKAEKTAAAFAFYSRLILARCFRYYFLYWTRRREKKMIYARAYSIYSIQLQKRIWHLWSDNLEFVEDNRWQLERKKANACYCNALLRKTFGQWKKENATAANMKILEENATSFWASCIRLRHFRMWRKSVPLLRRRRSLFNRAALHYNHVLSTWAYFTWGAAYSDQECLRNMNENAERQREHNLLKNYYWLWKRKTIVVSTAMQQWMEAFSHRRLFICRQIVRRWFCFTTAAKKKRQLFALAHSTSVSRVTHKTWRCWRECLCLKRASRVKYEIGAAHFAKQILIKFLLSWKTFCGRRKRKVEKLNLAWALHRGQISRRMLEAWKSYVLVCTAKKRQTVQALSWRSGKLQARFILAWREEFYLMQRSAEEKEAKLEEARPHLTRPVLRSFFRRWRHAQNACQRIRNADIWTNKRLALKAFNAWKYFSRLQIYQELQSGHAERHQRKRLLSSAFSCWINKRKARLEQQEKCRLVLIFWSQNLLRRCFAAWLDHTADSQNFKRRVQRALESRHRRLIKKGVQAWIEYSWSACFARSDRLARLKSKDSARLLQRASAAGRQWRRWARKRASQREIGREASHPEAHVACSKVAELRLCDPRLREFERLEPRTLIPSSLDFSNERSACQDEQETEDNLSENDTVHPEIPLDAKRRRELKLEIISKINERLDDLVFALQTNKK
ncbi:protein SFI1 homolog isoform X2 [Oscarella lobularis]|uniref:protein SFI1 homolog isoform X2 n=1 Tax=Oscarella lobularis TaxID=121494 RepID=UPI0033131A15